MCGLGLNSTCPVWRRECYPHVSWKEVWLVLKGRYTDKKSIWKGFTGTVGARPWVSRDRIQILQGKRAVASISVCGGNLFSAAASDSETGPGGGLASSSVVDPRCSQRGQTIPCALHRRKGFFPDWDTSDWLAPWSFMCLFTCKLFQGKWYIHFVRFSQGTH